MVLRFLENDGTLIRVELVGNPSMNEIIKSLDALYTKHQFHHILWDCKSGSLSGGSADLFNKLATTGAKYKDKRGAGAKTALLVSTKEEVHLIRAFAGVSSTVTPILFEASTELDTLMDWLSA